MIPNVLYNLSSLIIFNLVISNTALPRKKGPVRIRGQRSLAEFARGKTQEVAPYEDLVRAQMGTRNFPAFTVGSGGTQLDEFLDWLQGVEGQNRREREAIQIAVDVSKALR